MTKFTPPPKPDAPTGADGKLTQQFQEALKTSFALNGTTAIKKLSEDNPSAYLRLIQAALEGQLPANPINGLSDNELETAISVIRSTVDARAGADAGEVPPSGDKPPQKLRAVRKAARLP
ncbi:MAG: hypothetical protein ABL973_20760 [Micropepsaceae bacterium]